MAEFSEIVSQTKVRDLIFAFERQSSSLASSDEGFARPRAKSTGNALTYKIFRQPKLEIHDISDIETELVKTETHLNYYEIYDKETHIAFQEQLFDIITGIVKIDGRGDERIAEKKKQFIEQAQKLAKVLNGKLPFDNQRKGTKKVYAAVVRKQDQYVAKTQEYPSEVNSSRSAEGTQSPVPSSVYVSSELENSNETVTQSDGVSQNSVVSPKSGAGEVDSSFLPSVKKLKAFFSFRRQPEDKPKVSTTVTRSRSMLWKTKYREERHSSATSHSEASNDLPEEIDETEEDTDSLTYNEPSKETQDFRVDVEEVKHNVSVLKLKNLFEGKSQDTSQGLEIFAKKQTDAIAIPYTEMNLGAFRLKRSLSGSYMNYVGLLNKVDLSKSVSDLSSRKEDELDDEESKPSGVHETPGPGTISDSVNGVVSIGTDIGQTTTDDKQVTKIEPENISEELNSPLISAKETSNLLVEDHSKLTASASATTSKKVQLLVSSIESRSQDSVAQTPQPKEPSISAPTNLTVHKLVSSIEKQHTTQVVEQPSEYSLYWDNTQTVNNVRDLFLESQNTNEMSSTVEHISETSNGIPGSVQVIEEPREYSLLSESETNSVANATSSIETSHPDSTTKETDASLIESSNQELRQSLSSSNHNVEDKVAIIEDCETQKPPVVEPSLESPPHSQDEVVNLVQEIVSSIESQSIGAQVEHSVHSQVSISHNVEHIVRLIERRVSENEGVLHTIERSEDGYLASRGLLDDSASGIQEAGRSRVNSAGQSEGATSESNDIESKKDSVSEKVENGGDFIDTNGNLSVAQVTTHSTELKSQTTTSTQHFHTSSHSVVGAAVVKNDHAERPEHIESSRTKENEDDVNANERRKIEYAASNDNIVIQGSYIENFKDLEEEIFKEADTLENVDEEFEKLLRENNE
ncbi:uncharacterized protein LOC132699354 isoform X2 [Cylas formicarius]|uniref:uncharacterized protein LOC132699354 isoform X2 n=1 Tax=Cylas formicarius TaxID=197179 RepID=UPI0029587A72|nr:uncharacterized protein LOC132699354 isoform X2 [Cylas formicarius]